MFEKRNKRLNEALMKKFGYAEKESTEEELRELFGKGKDWEAEAERINIEADAECEELAEAFEEAVAQTGPGAAPRQRRETMELVAKNYSRKCPENYKNRCEELLKAWVGPTSGVKALRKARSELQGGCWEMYKEFAEDPNNAELVKKLQHDARQREPDPITGRDPESFYENKQEE